MESRFESIEDIEEYIDFLEMKGKTVPQWVLDEKESMERADKINPDEYIFGTMAAHNPYMTEEKEQVVRKMTEELMSNAPNATQPCLLLGKVQCGKTDTFLNIMGLCFDRGIDIAVVMTKGTNTLTTQTIQRLQKDFRFFEDKSTYGQKVIIKVYDILDLGHRGGISDAQLNDPAKKFIIVVKKEDTNLGYLNEIFDKSELLRSKKVLVCDDEADFASRNYYKRKNEISLLKIAEHIEAFIKKPAFCRYLQITATPYSLFLQPDGTIQLRDGEEASPWLPRYTGLVPIHSKYIGGRQYYELSEDENSMYSCLFQPVDEICIDILSARNEWYKKSSIHSQNLDSLNYAVVSYFFATAVRSIQVRKGANKRYKSSCLIHCEVAIAKHEWQEDLITKIIDDIKNAFLYKQNSDLHILDLESVAYESLRHSNELGNKYELIHENFPTFGEVEAELKQILENDDYIVQVINSNNPVSALLNEKGQLRLEATANIFIGGSILDRGITIDNMLCFFYGRDPMKFQMDTVLQHARMYGARDKEDMACTRFFTTETIYNVLKSINNIDSVMYDYLKYHQDKIQTNDFLTSMVIMYDRRVRATAANKYTPSNTRVLKPFLRILPKGFQTGTSAEIANTIKQIDEIIASVPGYSQVTDDDPFFLLDYDTALKIIELISSTFVYGEKWHNIGWEWDQNEMITALEHCCFNTDGKIYCQVCADRNMSRERKNVYDPRGRFIDSPETGADIAKTKHKATDRPVLTLQRQNGSADKGWRDTPFYWPILMLHKEMQAGIFTINDKKKACKQKKQIALGTIDNYPPEEILHLTTDRENFFMILNCERRKVARLIKPTTCGPLLKYNEYGQLIRVEGLDPNKFYCLTTYNDGVFPFEIRQYKYIHLRTSMDKSGSQMIFKLDETKPYVLKNSPFKLTDVHYDDTGATVDAENHENCHWFIEYRIASILESVFCDGDEEAYDAYLENKTEEKEAKQETE